LLSTFLQRLAQKHQVYLTAHASSGNPAFESQVNGIAQTFRTQGATAAEATAQAYRIIERTLIGQATVLAYIDIISVGAVAVACLVPLAFIMKRPRRGAAPVAAH